MAEFLGVEIGKDRVGLALVSMSPAGARISFFENREYPSADLSLVDRASFAAKLAAGASAGKAPLALSLPGEAMSMCPLVVPFTKRAHIERTLKFEIEDKLPFDVNSAVLDFAVTGSHGGSSRLIVVALQSQLLRDVVAPFEARFLKVRLVTAEALSASALSSVIRENDFALLDVGLSDWKLSLVRDGRLAFARAARALPAGESLEAAIAAWFRQGLMAVPSEPSPERVFLTGCGSGALDPETLSQALSLEVRRLEFPLESLPSGEPRDAEDNREPSTPAVSAAASACLPWPEIDLVRAARGRQSVFDVLFAPLAAALVLATLLLALLGIGYRNDATRAADAKSQALAAEIEVWESLFPDRTPPGGSPNLGLKSALKEVEIAGAAQALGSSSDWFLRALHVLSTCAPKGAGLTFRQLHLRQGKLVIDVSSRDTSADRLLRDAINAEGAFVAESVNVRIEEGLTTFQIQMQQREPNDVQ